MIQRIQPGEVYWADIDGNAAKVRVIERSRELPHLWLCSDPSVGRYLLVADAAFHRIGEIKRDEVGD